MNNTESLKAYLPLIILFSGFIIINLAVMIKKKCFFRSFLLSAITGTGSLFAVNLLCDITGVKITESIINLVYTAVTGAAGTLSLLLLNMFM